MYDPKIRTFAVIGIGMLLGGCPSMAPGPGQNDVTSGPLPDNVLALPNAAGTYSTQDIGSLGGATTVLAISDSAQAAGHAITADGATHAFLWDRVSLKDLGVLGSDTASRGFALAEDARVVGDSSGVGRLGVVFHQNSAAEVPGLPGNETTIYGINSAGSMVGASLGDDGQQHSILIGVDGAVTDLGVGSAYGIGESGAVVGSNGTHAFLMPGLGQPATDLGTLGGVMSAAFAVNTTGVAVGSSETLSGLTRAFIHTNGALFDLGVLPGGNSSAALAINEVNQIVGSATDAQGNSHAVLFLNGTIVDLNSHLNPPDQQLYTLTSATGINASGQICCNTAQGKALILTPELGADFLQFKLVATGIRPENNIARVAMTPAQSTPTGEQYSDGLVVAGRIAMARSGKILIAGEAIWSYFEDRLLHPYYFTDAFNYILGGTAPQPVSNAVKYYRTFIDEAGSFRDLGVPPGTYNDIMLTAGSDGSTYGPAPYLTFNAAAMSPNGQYVFGTSAKLAIVSFREFVWYYDPIPPFIFNTALPLPDTQFMYVNGGFSEYTGREVIAAINDSGQTCGYLAASSSAATGEPVGASLSGNVIGSGRCLAINDSGEVVGINGDNQAFLYSAGAQTALDLGGDAGAAYDINNLGEVVGESKTADGETHAFIYSNGHISDLGVIPGGNYSSARFINDAGEIVGYAREASGVQHPVVFRDGVAIDLNTLLIDTADQALGPFPNLHGLDNDGNVLVSKALTFGEENVYIMERLQ